MSLLERIKKAFSSPDDQSPLDAQRCADVPSPSSSPSSREGTAEQPPRVSRVLRVELTPVGRTDSSCPHCSSTLARRPARKAKCPHCGHAIYVRTRPLDRLRVLVTDREATLIESQWSAISGSDIRPYVDRDELAKHKAELAAASGHEPSERDAVWSLLNKELLLHARNADWGLYRNTRLSMAVILEEEAKFLAALQAYFDVCYLDICGATNTGGLRGLAARAFDLTDAFLAPAVTAKVAVVVARLQMTEDHARKEFVAMADRTRRNLRLPVSSERAWDVLSNELYLDPRPVL